MEARHAELRQPAVRRPGHRAESPFVDASLRVDEVIADFDRIGDTVLVAAVVAVRRVEARVQDRELEESTRTQHAKSFGEHAGCFRNVHQAHERGSEIERAVGEGEFHGARGRVGDAERGTFLLGLSVADESFRNVDRGHLRAALGDEAGVVPFTATEIEARQALDRRQHGEESRRVQMVAENIVARAREFGPRVGVAIPEFSRADVIHGTALGGRTLRRSRRRVRGR